MLIERLTKYFLAFVSIFAVLGGIYAKGKSEGKSKYKNEESEKILNRVRDQSSDDADRANDDISTVRDRLRKNASDR